MKYAAMFACAMPFAALAGIVPTNDGALVRSEDSKPVFLVSTTGKWLSFSDSDKRRKEMAKAAAEHPGYEWLYGEPNSIDKFRRMGFNSVNFFALPTGYLALMPDSRKGLGPEDAFAELVRLAKEYGWYDPARKVDIFRCYFDNSKQTWSRFLEAARSLGDMPVYIDFHTSRPQALSKARKIIANKIDTDGLFTPKAGGAFNLSFNLSNPRGRQAIIDMFVHDAKLYRELGVRPWAYKVMNEPSYVDPAVSQKERERLTSELARDLRRELRKVEPGMPVFVQTHRNGWRETWNSICLYDITREMDIVSIGTGGYAYENPERAPKGVAFADADSPGAAMTDWLGRIAFYRSLAKGKPLVASELYFMGTGDRSRPLESALWHCAAEGISMCNIWEWTLVGAGDRSASHTLSNPRVCAPETWNVLPRTVERINSLADFFPAGVRREKARVACLFSNPTRLRNPGALGAYCAAETALALANIRADCIFEEQLVPGDDFRLDDYEAIVLAGVETKLPTTDAALAGFASRGGHVVEFAPDAGSGAFCNALDLKEKLAAFGIGPVAEVRDVETSDLAPYIRVFRAAGGNGLTGWFLANYSDVARVVTVSAPELKGAKAVDPFRPIAWPTEKGGFAILVPAQFHAIAITGDARRLAARFGEKTSVSVAALKTQRDRMIAQAEANAPRRAAIPLDLRAVANGGFDNLQNYPVGTVWEDRHGRDLKGVPYHRQTFSNVDFDIIRFDYNENRTTVALRSKTRPSGLAATPPIELGNKPLRGLAFLQAATHAKEGEVAYTAVVRYADGEIAEVPMRTGKEILDWEGKGFHFHEWENPRPSAPLSTLVLKGGDGESCANVVAISALPTVFAKPYAHRLDVKRETVHAPKMGMVIPLSKPLGSDEIRGGVLRLLVSQPSKPDGGKPQFAKMGVQVFGASADGTQCRTSPSATQQAINLMGQGRRASVAAADEWAEIEIPLSELLPAVSSENGMAMKMASITGIRLNSGAGSSSLYREVRIEY